jgi:hypothetical protein
MRSREHSETDLSVESEGSDDTGLAQALEVGGFVLRAPRRRPLFAAGVFVLGVTVTLAVVLLAPRVYTVDTTILVQRNVVIPLLGNPHRPVPADWDVPGRGTSESILRRDNLVALIKETELETRWDVGRSPILKLKDALARVVFGPMSEKDRLRVLVGTLEKRLSVQADDTTIKISLVWHDPEMAYRLVSCVEQSFLKDRSAAGTVPITDTIAILHDEEARQRELIAAALAEAQKLQPQTPAAMLVQQAGAPQERSAANELAERSEVVNRLAEKRRTIQAAEEARQRRLADLQTRLAELRMTYASAHPLVLAMEERIRQAEVVPQELVQMKQQEEALLRGIQSFFPPNGGVHAPNGGAHEAPPELLDVLQRAGVAGAGREDTPELAAAKARLTMAVQKYEDLRDRIDSARLELQTAEAAFKYRYAIVQPPELPAKPTKPSTLVILVGGLAASVAFAIAAAVAKDLAKGRFIEPWQVRRRLPIPLLAELEEP